MAFALSEVAVALAASEKVVAGFQKKVPTMRVLFFVITCSYPPEIERAGNVLTKQYSVCFACEGSKRITQCV